MPAATKDRIKILDVQMGRARITIKGTGDGLIVHRFGAKARKQIDKTGRITIQKKAPRVPEEEFLDACYIIDKKNPEPRYDGFQENPKFDKRKHLYGIPANAIKGAMISATLDLGKEVPKTLIKRSVFVHGQYSDLVPIVSPKVPEMRVDVCRLSGAGRAPDLRYRPWWRDWSVTFTVTWNDEVMSLEAIVNILNRAGIFIGLCENRPEKSGNAFGTFEIVAVEQVDA